MKEWIKEKLLGGKSNTLDSKRKSRLDQAEEEATGTKTPPKAYKAGGTVRRGYGKARGC